MPESRVRTAWRAFLRWLDGPIAGRIAGAGDGLFTLGLLLFFVQLCFRFVALFEVSLQQVPVPGSDMPSRSALELARAVGAVGILLLASVLGAMRAPSYLDHD